MRALLEANRTIVADLDLALVLRRIVESAAAPGGCRLRRTRRRRRRRAARGVRPRRHGRRHRQRDRAPPGGARPPRSGDRQAAGDPGRRRDRARGCGRLPGRSPADARVPRRARARARGGVRQPLPDPHRRPNPSPTATRSWSRPWRRPPASRSRTRGSSRRLGAGRSGWRPPPRSPVACSPATRPRCAWWLAACTSWPSPTSRRSCCRSTPSCLVAVAEGHDAPGIEDARYPASGTLSEHVLQTGQAGPSRRCRGHRQRRRSHDLPDRTGSASVR